MQHFPIYLDLDNRRVVLSGGGETALAKLRLILKTTAQVEVFAETAKPDLQRLARAGKLTLHFRRMTANDAAGAALVYAAEDDATLDAETARLAHASGAMVNIVDNLEASDFITPAIVDRDPVTIAIGTEGAAPVLARMIKEDLEARLPSELGLMARVGKAFRAMADRLPMGRKRRDFWAEYYQEIGPRLSEGGAAALEGGLETLLDKHLAAEERSGHLDLAGTGPGDPELMTLAARKALDAADLVIHAPGTPGGVLELARREAWRVEATDEEAAVARAGRAIARGLQVVWLVPGAPPRALAARLAGEGWSFRLIPGIAAPVQARTPANQPGRPPASTTDRETAR
ncbi:NAD(P)-dependent oxidoreductase [Pseudoroseicyclus tamaricis]|uniref:precorrin-2 dehydrogenase n=1 Tax=Pseudoroseicyclus tamaricis TaxID=2705421 RepID=A0A6B2K581_9RHOB|nr:NAD(P)-dependent oxidoreductase [Pseudoroseicyclus tamaricis]NDV01906.1 siroheme synthase [Pseudoroseicyclus tamaricis]